MTAVVAIGAVGRTEATPGRALFSSPCRTPDSLTAKHLHYVRASSVSLHVVDVGWRGDIIPHVTDTTLITVVTDSATCARALASYDTLADQGGTLGEIEVLRLDTLFVLSHPDVHTGEWTMRYVVDSAMHYLRSYLF
jgi:hypothetical protein